MSTYAILNEDLTFREWREFDEVPTHKPGRVLPLEDTSPPSFDQTTEKLVELPPVVTKDSVARAWEVVALSSDELKSVAMLQEALAIKADVAETKGGTGSIEDRVARLEKAVAHLIEKLL